MLGTGWIKLNSEIVKQWGKRATNHKSTRKQARAKWQGKMQNHDHGNRLIKKQKQVLSKHYQASTIVILFLSNFCSRWHSVLVTLSSAYLFQAWQPRCIFHWSVNMIQSVNLNHTYLNTTLWAFRKGCFCQKKTKTVEMILLTGFELTNPDWGNRSCEATASLSYPEFFWTYW